MRGVAIGLMVLALGAGMFAQQGAPTKAPGAVLLEQAQRVLKNAEAALSKTPEYQAYQDALALVRSLDAATKPPVATAEKPAAK